MKNTRQALCIKQPGTHFNIYNTFWNTQVLLISIWLACQLQQIDRFSGWLLFRVRSSVLMWCAVHCTHWHILQYGRVQYFSVLPSPLGLGGTIRIQYSKVWKRKEHCSALTDSSTGVWRLSLIHPITARLDYWYTVKDTVSKSAYFVIILDHTF